MHPSWITQKLRSILNIHNLSTGPLFERIQNGDNVLKQTTQMHSREKRRRSPQRPRLLRIRTRNVHKVANRPLECQSESFQISASAAVTTNCFWYNRSSSMFERFASLGICNLRTCWPNHALVHFDIGSTHTTRPHVSSAYNGEVKRPYSNCLAGVLLVSSRSPDAHDKRVNSLDGPHKQSRLLPNGSPSTKQ